MAIGAYLGCSASKKTSLGSSGSETAGSGGASASGVGGSGVTVTSGQGGGEACVKFTASAKLSPAAMLILVDRSASMADNNKWAFAAQSIVQALDQPVFDTMSVGLMAVPSGTVNAPQCVAIFGLSKVACAVPAFPQVDVKLAGKLKSSDASGVRKEIKDYFKITQPQTDDPDSTPMYGGIQLGLSTLKALDMKRILLIVSDGSWCCNVFSNRPGYDDCNGCTREWENPQNFIDLLAAANKDPKTPVETFVVGVPGADTYDPSGCNYPPYRMRAALSAIGYAGAPNFAPANCNGKTYSQAAMDPTTSCHVDLTKNNFDAQALADTIKKVRSQVVGCVYPLPAAPPGEMIDLNAVNVEVTINGTKQVVKKRSDKMDTCAADGCWDYDDKMPPSVVLIGKTCNDVNNANTVDVSIKFGCASVVK
jgi:hypothetical protein